MLEIQRKLHLPPQAQTIEVVIWKEWFVTGANNGRYTWPIVEQAINSFDCAIMLFAADDVVNYRDQDVWSTRDNVLIEAGAFGYAKGFEKVFILRDKNDNYRIPTDYLGINTIGFDYSRGADNPEAYRTMVEKIGEILAREVQKVTTQSEPEKLKNRDYIESRGRKGKIQ